MRHLVRPLLVIAATALGCAELEPEAGVLEGSVPAAKADGSGQHWPAHHCEIFIDKVTAYQGSHALRAATVFVKTINDRLDAAIDVVGFRYRPLRNGAPDGDWLDSQLQGWAGATDYWSLSLTFSHDWLS